MMDQKTLDFMKARVDKAEFLQTQIEKYSLAIKELKRYELSTLFITTGDFDYRKGIGDFRFGKRLDGKVIRSMRESLRRVLEKDLKRLQKEWDEL